MSSKHGPKDTLTVIVSGTPVEVKANENEQISVIVKEALRLANQTGRPEEDWELRASEAEGAQPLDPAKKLRDYGLNLSSVLWLGLGSGGGGA
jgi:uncharacterized protein DUF2604